MTVSAPTTTAPTATVPTAAPVTDRDELWAEALAAHPYGTLSVPVGLLRHLCAQADDALDPDDMTELRREADTASEIADDLEDREADVARLEHALDTARDALQRLQPHGPARLDVCEALDRLDKALAHS